MKTDGLKIHQRQPFVSAPSVDSKSHNFPLGHNKTQLHPIMGLGFLFLIEFSINLVALVFPRGEARQRGVNTSLL